MAARRPALAGLLRQILAFGWIGVVAAFVHFGLLVGLVEGGLARPVPATLAGYVAGGIVSYLLNRRIAFASDRPHREATWRFATVAAIGFALTWTIMHGLVERLALPYFPAQIATTLIVMAWSFLAHKFWSFGGPQATGRG
jgi:putative flippase GtrA